MSLDEAMSFSQSVSRMNTEPIETELRGSDLKPEDRKRLGAGYRRVVEVMKDGNWHDMRSVAFRSETELDSAKRYVRHMKKQGYKVERRNEGGGLNLYRALPLFTPEI